MLGYNLYQNKFQKDPKRRFDMSVKYHNFGGVIGWNLQKYFPNLSSDSYLKLQRSTRNKLQQEYIDYFLSTDEPPGNHQSLQQHLFLLYCKQKCGKAPIQAYGGFFILQYY